MEALGWRPLAIGDAGAAADLLNAMETVDGIGEHYGEQDTLQELVDPYLDLERASLGAFDGGSMVGFVKISWKPATGPHHRVTLDGGVRPSHRRRSLGSTLVTAGLEMAEVLRVHHDPTLRLTVAVQRADHIPGAAELFLSQGFAPEQWSQEGRRSLADPLPPASVPEGFVIEPWSPDGDEAFRLIRNETFVDLPELPPDGWRNRMTDHTFQPALSFLARDRGGAAAAMLLTKHWTADTAVTGIRDAHLLLLGTRPPHRGEGVAGALVGTALGAAAALGFDQATVRVDSARASTGLGLFGRAGFTATQRHVRWSREV